MALGGRDQSAWFTPYERQGPTTLSAPTVASGRVYIAGADGYLYVLDAATGACIDQCDLGVPLAAQPKRILTLGDSLKSDIRGANRLGLTSALVLTGITSEAAVHGLAPDDEKVPDIVFAGLCGPAVLPP